MTNTTTNQFGQTNQAANNQTLPFGNPQPVTQQTNGANPFGAAGTSDPFTTFLKEKQLAAAKKNAVKPQIGKTYQLTNLQTESVNNYIVVTGTDTTTGADYFFNVFDTGDTAMAIVGAHFDANPNASRQFTGWDPVLKGKNVEVVFKADKNANFFVIDTVKFF